MTVLPLREREPIGQGLGLAEIAAMLNGDHMRIDDRRRVISRQVPSVEPSSTKRISQSTPVVASALLKPLVQLGQIAFLVHHWNDD